MSELITMQALDASEVYSSGLDDIIEDIRRKAKESPGDVSTASGRKEIASMAHKVARSKTALDDLGKTLTAEWKAKAKAVDQERKSMRERLDELKAEVRAPLTDWETEQERIKAEQERIEAERIEAERKAKEAAEEAERRAAAEALAQQQAEIARREAEIKEREEKLKAAEEERRRQEAAARAEQARKEAEVKRREEEAQAQKEAAERARVQAEQDRIEAERRAKAEKEAAEQAAKQRAIDEAQRIEDARAQAVKDERERIERQKAEREAAEAKALADERWKKEVHAELAAALCSVFHETSREIAEAMPWVVEAIANGEIPRLRIDYGEGEPRS